VQHLLQYVKDEAKDKLGQEWDTSTWTTSFPKQIPRQTNGCDCGVFALKFAEYRGRDKAWDFSQKDMKLMRFKVS
jgi:sentrin-specific protease 1